MASIFKTTRKGKTYFYFATNGDNGKRKQVFLGTEPPWPKTQGWTGLTAKQLASLERILERRKVMKIPKAPAIKGKYRTLVIDPPWPVAWPKRLSRPNQLGMPYPTMSLEEIKRLPIQRLAMPDGCHLYLWVTHGFLPIAFKLLKRWGFDYKCLLTWVKNVGFTPYSFMLTTEFCLYAQKGKLPLLKLGKRTDFTAKAREHSRKPDKFYKLVRLVSPEPRLEMFSRELRKGFVAWGNELNHFEDKNDRHI